MAQAVSEGIYFLHLSFLKEVNDTWLDKKEIGKPAKVFMDICLASSYKELNICNRTLDEISKTKYTFCSAPAFYDLLIPKSASPLDGETPDTDAYSLRVASLQKSRPYPIYFITSDSEKQKMMDLAKRLNYSMTILSPSDF